MKNPEPKQEEKDLQQTEEQIQQAETPEAEEQPQKAKMKLPAKKWLRVGLIVAFVAVFIVSGIYVARYLINSKKEANKYDDLANLKDNASVTTPRPTITEPTDSTRPSPTLPNDSSPRPTVPEGGATAPSEPAQPQWVEVVDPETGEVVKMLPEFQELYAINNDLVAWIKIPGTDINYPVTHAPDQKDYYLTRNFYKEKSQQGCIYIQENCNVEQPTDNVVLYGHRMRDGSMFAPLLEFRDREFFDKHRYAIVYTEEKTLIYQIFAAYRWDDRHILRNYDFSGDLMRYSYISYVLNIRDMYSVIADDVDVDTDDRILTLSCCTYVDGNRFIVQGVLVGER